jgi:predicted DNA-binding antitoxin AbrB/MazE fold protein
MAIMEIQGHYQNGMIVPNDNISLPDGTQVTITVRPAQGVVCDSMSEEQQKRYLQALERIDLVGNENPGDSFSGADHNRELYGNEP